MEDLWRQHDRWLFAVLPYVAALAFLLLALARRYGMPPFGQVSGISGPRSEQSSAPSGHHFAERVLFGYGILVILCGHLLAFLLPKEVLLWNSQPMRLYVLEGTALFFSLLTLVGIMITVARGIFNSASRRATLRYDWVLYALLIALLGSGVFIALFYPWGSSWYATTLVPYLISVVKLEPDISYVSGLPSIVKLHIVSAYLLLAFFPFTRLMLPLSTTAGARSTKHATTESIHDRVEDKLAEARENGSEDNSRLMTGVLSVAIAISLLALVPRLSGAHLPGNHQGYEPVQPIAFSHRLHAGDLQVSCLYCHFGAEKSRHAGLPSANVCMNCHRFVSAPLPQVRAELELSREEKRPPRNLVSSELGKLYEAMGLNQDLKPDRTKTPRPIRWVKVHNLPAFAHFDHRAHVAVGVSCETCHGPVGTMERIRQVEDLSMGWCVRCHREANQMGVAGKQVRASIDCSTCHY
jgi:nitrate reductase gamma subunit